MVSSKLLQNLFRKEFNQLHANLCVYFSNKRNNLLPKAFTRCALQNLPGGRHQVHLTMHAFTE